MRFAVEMSKGVPKEEHQLFILRISIQKYVKRCSGSQQRIVSKHLRVYFP